MVTGENRENWYFAGFVANGLSTPYLRRFPVHVYHHKLVSSRRRT